MSFWQFLRTWFTSVLHWSWHGGHLIHQTCVFLTAGLLIATAILGVHASSHHEEPITLVVAPLVGAILLFFVSLVGFAYRIYRDEYNRRIAAGQRLVPVWGIRGIGPRSNSHYRIMVHI